ncbi:hypothetical protein CRYUN_Cryun25bG0100400 [Craigia yunnanensis]
MCKIRTSSAVIWNTVDVLEQSSLQKMQKQCQVPIFPIGPLRKVAPASSSSLIKEDTSCITWLDKQIQKSVLYVSLGSVASIDKNEVIEMAWGLANSKQPFLWVIRPGLVDDLEWNKLLPEGFIEAGGKNGCIVKWAPQTGFSTWRRGRILDPLRLEFNTGNHIRSGSNDLQTMFW